VYGDQSGGEPNPLLALAGDGRGFVGQVRLWGVILLIGAGVSLAIGGWAALGSVPETTTAAAIEDGAHPTTYDQRRRRYQSSRAEIVGRLVQADALVLPGRQTWIYAPLVSERPGADEHPRVYFAASEAAYNRDLDQKRFRGILTRGLPRFARQAFESRGRAVGDDVYLLQDDGSVQGDVGVARALLVWGALLGVLGVAALLFAARRQRGPRPPLGGSPDAA